MGEKMEINFRVEQVEYLLDNMGQLQNQMEGMTLGQAKRVNDKKNVDDDMIDALKKVPAGLIAKMGDLPPKKPVGPMEGIFVPRFYMWCRRCRRSFVWNKAPFKCPRRKCLETGELVHLCIKCCKQVDDIRREHKKVKRLEKRKLTSGLKRLQ